MVAGRKGANKRSTADFSPSTAISPDTQKSSMARILRLRALALTSPRNTGFRIALPGSLPGERNQQDRRPSARDAPAGPLERRQRTRELPHEHRRGRGLHYNTGPEEPEAE